MVTWYHVNVDAQIPCLVKEVFLATLQGVIVDKLSSVEYITQVQYSFNFSFYQSREKEFIIKLLEEGIKLYRITSRSEVSIVYRGYFNFAVPLVVS
jgi:hypothetical protein|tara:strand:- start:626 stop:913 length:288 start_codon:yes stop_codon:yes gene_type:complete